MDGATWDVPQQDLDGLDLKLSGSTSKRLHIQEAKKETRQSSKMLRNYLDVAVNVLAVIGWLFVGALVFDTLFLQSRLLAWFIAG